MGFFDFLLGEDPKTEVDQASRLSPNQQQAEQTLTDFIQSAQGRPGAVPERTGGPLVAGTNPLEFSSLQALEDRSRFLATNDDPRIREAADSLVNILTRGPADVDEFFRTNVRQPLLETFEEDIIPGISRRNPSGFFGSERREAERRAREDLVDTLASERARIGLETRESDTAAALEAAQILPSLATSRTSELLSLLEAGQLPRGIEQREIDELFNRQQTAEENRIRRARLLNQFLGVPTTQNIVTQTEGSTGILGSLISGAAAGFGGSFGGAAGGALAGAIL